MDKIKVLKSLKKIICSTTLASGLMIGESLYSYSNIDDVYNNIKSNTSRQIIKDYTRYNNGNNIQLDNPITAYNYYLDYIVYLYQEVLHLEDPAEIFMVYCYMKDNGYLSYNRKYSYGKPNIDIYGKKGINIALGQGVCEHETEMFNDILCKMNIENYKIICSIDNENDNNGINLKIENQEEIHIGETISYYSNLNKITELSITPLFNKKASNENPTHAFTAIKHNNKVSYFDTTNMVIWNYTGGNKWRCIPIHGKLKNEVDAKYSPTYTKMENDIGTLLQIECNDDLEICQNIYEELMFGEYDMLFSQWNNFIPDELFDSMKTIEDFKKIRRKLYD